YGSGDPCGRHAPHERLSKSPVGFGAKKTGNDMPLSCEHEARHNGAANPVVPRFVRLLCYIHHFQPSAMFTVTAQVRYINQMPVNNCQTATRRPPIGR